MEIRNQVVFGAAFLLLSLLGMGLISMAGESQEEGYPVEKLGLSHIRKLWSGFDPCTLPLETEVIRNISEQDIHIQQLYFTGEIWEGEKTRVYAIRGAQMGTQNLPGILHIHGGGQTASMDWVRFWAKRGYVCVSFDFCGDWRKNSPDRTEFTRWGKVNGHMADVGGGHTMKPDPTHNPWFHWALTARRALTLLETDPQVDPEKLGVFGISVGGTLTWVVAGIDPRVKAAVPIYGCGWNTFSDLKQTSDANQSEESRMWRKLMGSESYAPLVQCPLLFLNATQDFHGNMDRSFLSLALAPSSMKRVAFTPNYNHHIEPVEGHNLPLWMETHLKGSGLVWPRTPRIEFLGGQTVPRIRIEPDLPGEVENIRTYYALNGFVPSSRFWRLVETQPDKNNTFTAEAPILSPTDTLFAFANVTYKSGVTLSSLLITTQATNLCSVTPTLKHEALIDDMADFQDWRFRPAYTDPCIDDTYFQDTRPLIGQAGFTLNLETFKGEINFDISTNKIGDPQWRGKGREPLLLEYYSRHVPKTLQFLITEHDWQPTRVEYFYKPDLTPATQEWTTLRLEPADLKTVDGKELPSWREVDTLTLTGTTDHAHPPIFRNLRWEN